MRPRSLLAALVLVLSPAAAGAEVLAVCGAPTGYTNAVVSSALVRPVAGLGTPLALSHDAKGYDLLVNWGEKSQHSLRAEGADVQGDALGSELIHLVVIREGSHSLEHFLFSFEDEDGPGDLIWNAPSDAPGTGRELDSYETTCLKAK